MNDHPPIFTRPVPLFPYSSPFRSRMRLWGSVAFIATSVGIGAALAGRGEELIIQTIVACLFGVFVATALLPNRPTPPGSRGSRPAMTRSEEHTSELQSLTRISYAVLRLEKKTIQALQVLIAL